MPRIVGPVGRAGKGVNILDFTSVGNAILTSSAGVAGNGGGLPGPHTFDDLTSNLAAAGSSGGSAAQGASGITLGKLGGSLSDRGSTAIRPGEGISKVF